MGVLLVILRVLVLLQELVVSGGELAVDDVAGEGLNLGLSVRRHGHVSRDLQLLKISLLGGHGADLSSAEDCGFYL